MKYRTKGTCSQEINFDIKDDGTVTGVEFLGGCNGNLQGIGKLVEGMKVDEIIEKLEGIRCGFKPTSCPDQLAKALREATGKQTISLQNSIQIKTPMIEDSTRERGHWGLFIVPESSKR